MSKRRMHQCPSSLKGTLSTIRKAKSTEAWRTVRDVLSDLPNVGLGRSSRKFLNHFLNPAQGFMKATMVASWIQWPRRSKQGTTEFLAAKTSSDWTTIVCVIFRCAKCAPLAGISGRLGFLRIVVRLHAANRQRASVTLAEVVAAPLSTALKAQAQSGKPLIARQIMLPNSQNHVALLA